MADASSLVSRALGGDRAAIDVLVTSLAPYVQRQVNAGLLRRRLADQAGRHDVVDLVRDLLVALFDDRGALLGQWNPQTPLEGFVEYLAFGQVAAVLDQVAPLPPEAAPQAGEAEAWWAATASGDPSSLPVVPEARAHTQAVLRPMEAHEAHAIAAEVMRAVETAGAAPAESTPPDAWSDPTRGEPGAPDPRHRRRGLIIAAVLGVGITGAVVAGTFLGAGDDASLPAFRLKARSGQAGAPPVYTLGQPIEVGLRPETPIDITATKAVGEAPDLTVAAVAVGPGDEVALWPYALQESADGALLLTGVVGEDLKVTPGPWRLVFVIGPREEVLGDASVLALDPEPPLPPLQRLKYTIEVEAPAP